MNIPHANQFAPTNCGWKRYAATHVVVVSHFPRRAARHLRSGTLHIDLGLVGPTYADRSIVP